MRTIQEKLERVQDFRPIDDVFFDIVNTGLHFFLKDVRPMLLFVMNHNIVDVSPLVEDRHLQSIFFCYSNN